MDTAASGSTSAGGQRTNNQSWTNEKESRLISLYGMYRLLWDSRHPEYYKKDSREHAIKAIAQSLDNEFNVVNVKDKIKSLRDYFVKELKKEAASRKSSAMRPYVSRWEHFRSWDFLRRVICCDPGVQPPSTAGIPSGPLDGPHCVSDAMLPALLRPRASRRTCVKQEHQDVFPAFFDAEGPDMILPSSPECSSDEDEERSSSGKSGSSPPPPPPPPPPPVPQSSGNSGVSHRDPSLPSGLLKLEQGSTPAFPSYPSRDSVMSPNPPAPKRTRLSSSSERPEENHPGGTPASCGVPTSTTKSPPEPSPAATCAASLPVGAESSRNPGCMTGGGSAVPFELEFPYEDEEELFCRQLLLELRQMERYRRDLARLRIRQMLFEMKYMGLHATFRGQGGS